MNSVDLVKSRLFESPKVFDKLLLPEDAPERQAIEISNPLGEDYSIMRTISLNGMLTSLATNFNRRNKDVRLYELVLSICRREDSSTHRTSGRENAVYPWYVRRGRLLQYERRCRRIF